MEIKSIKILGKDGCRNCSTMFQTTIDILAEKNIACDCQHVTDLQQIMAYGVMSLPGLVINDKVVSYGKILSKDDIERFEVMANLHLAYGVIAVVKGGPFKELKSDPFSGEEYILSREDDFYIILKYKIK